MNILFIIIFCKSIISFISLIVISFRFSVGIYHTVFSKWINQFTTEKLLHALPPATFLFFLSVINFLFPYNFPLHLSYSYVLLFLYLSFSSYLHYPLTLQLSLYPPTFPCSCPLSPFLWLLPSSSLPPTVPFSPRPPSSSSSLSS